MKLVLLSFVFVVLHVAVGRKLPDFVKACGRNALDRLSCLQKTMNDLKPYLIKGIPEMGVPPLDPLTITSLYFETGNGTNFGYSSNLTDLVFKGGKDFEVQGAAVDIERGIFEMTMYIPHFYVTGKYKANGKVLVIQFNSDGPMTANFTDVMIIGKWVATKITKKGREHFRFDKDDVEVNVKDIKARFDDLFKGNQQLTESSNNLFNENSDVLYDEIKPVIGSAISKLITSVLNRVHELYSNDVLYPE